MSLPSFAHYLPYWATRTVRVGDTDHALLILLDGTLVVGFDASGADVFAADNSQLNRHAERLRSAVNVLPADGFIQCDWRTGGSFDDVIDDYATRGTRGHPVLTEQRRIRADFLRTDPVLRRGRLVYYVGLRHAFGPLSSHAATPPPWVRLIDALTGSSKKDPYSIAEDDFQVAANSLVEITAHIKEELGSVGQKLRPLTEQDLIAEVYAALNPVSAQTTPPPRIVERAEELDPRLLRTDEYLVFRPLTLREQLPLGDMVWAEEHFTLDDPPLLHRVVSLQRLPAFTQPDFCLGLQFATTLPFRLSTTLVATDREKLTEQLIRKRNRMHAQAAGHVRDVAAEVALGEYEHVLETMLTADQRVFRASVSAVVSGHDHNELDFATRQLKEAFADVGGAGTTETGRQLYSFLGTLPGNGPQVPRQYTVITNNSADLLPYFVPSLGDKEAQLLYHTRQGTLRRLSFAASKPNKNALVLGGSGSGKSFNVANVFEQACLAEDGPVLVVDVQGPEVSNYRILCEVLGGTYTSLAGSHDIAFNPFFAHSELLVPQLDPVTGVNRPVVDEDKVSYLKQLVCVMAVPGIATHPQKSLLYDIARTAILSAYAATKKENRPPLLRDVVAQLDVFRAPQPEYAPLARDMYLQLATWTKDPARARLLDRPSSFSSTSRFQVFDFHGLEKDPDLATVLLLSVSFYIWSAIQRYPRDVTKFILFDETWKLLTHPVAAEIVAELYRTGRKWGASTWAITQDLNDFLNSPIHSALLANAATIFLNQHVTDHERVGELVGLNARQTELFKGLRFKGGVYSELLLVDRANSDATVLQLRPTPYDLWLNTTNPVDVGFRDRLQKERGLDIVGAIRACADEFPTGAPDASKKDASKKVRGAA